MLVLLFEYICALKESWGDKYLSRMPSLLEKKMTREDDIVDVLGELHYCGVIDHQTFVNFVQMSLTDNVRFRSLLDCYQVFSRTFHITVELMQNVNKHATRWGGEKIIHETSPSTNDMNPCPCWISYHLLVTQEEVVIRCSNFIVESTKKRLEAKLENSSLCSDEEKRMKYMAQLSSGTLSERGGAGLGLIDVARKSSGFEWSFTPYVEGRYLFTVESLFNIK